MAHSPENGPSENGSSDAIDEHFEPLTDDAWDDDKLPLLEFSEGYNEDKVRTGSGDTEPQAHNTPVEDDSSEESQEEYFAQRPDEHGNLRLNPEAEAEIERLSSFLRDDGTWDFGDQPYVETFPGYLDTMSRFIRYRRGVIDFQGWLKELGKARKRREAEEQARGNENTEDHP